jgi:hypothetical protein
MRHTFKIVGLILLVVCPAVLPNLAAQTPGRKLSVGQTYCTGTTPCVLTYHNDNSRDGVNPHESTFKASTLSSSNHPVPQWLATTDGLIYAQPLYVHQLQINGGAKNVVYVATQNNSVYALDADSSSSTGTILQQVNLDNASDLGSGYTEIAVPYTDLPGVCDDITPEVGITGTPVVDVSVTPPVIYLVTKHEDVDGKGVKTYRQKLHGLFADTLQEVPGSPVILDSTFAANHAPGFSPLYNNQRAGIALVNGANNTAKIWIAWGAHCDMSPYFGFAIEFAYNYTGTVGFSNAYTVFNSEWACQTKNCEGGIWMGGAAPAADGTGNVYLATGNGDDASQGSGEYGDSVIKLTDSGLVDFYSPPDFHAMEFGKSTVACSNPSPPKCPNPCQLDITGQFCQIAIGPDNWDLGAGGVVLLSPTFQANNPEMVAAGKQGLIYTIFTGNLGQVDSQFLSPDKYACSTANAPSAGAIAQCFQGLALHNTENTPDSGSRGAPAFLAGGTGKNVHNYLYVAGIEDVLKAYHFVKANGVGLFQTSPAGAAPSHHFRYPGASPTVSWDQSKSTNINDAIVWALDTGSFGRPDRAASAAVLYSYRAIPTGGGVGTLGHELWDTSAYNSTAPGNPGAVKFIVPTIAEGKIFLAGGAQNYQPGTSNCPTPTITTQPKACGGLAMYK